MPSTVVARKAPSSDFDRCVILSLLNCGASIAHANGLSMQRAIPQAIESVELFLAAVALTVGFPDGECRICRHILVGQTVALHLRVEQLPVDVQAAGRLGTVAAACCQRLADHSLLESRDSGREIETVVRHRV